jgi:hypothetical protein
MTNDEDEASKEAAGIPRNLAGALPLYRPGYHHRLFPLRLPPVNQIRVEAQLVAKPADVWLNGGLRNIALVYASSERVRQSFTKNDEDSD